jgi:hypothetical protein
MALSARQCLGSYEVVAKIGAGGMGVRHRARFNSEVPCVKEAWQREVIYERYTVIPVDHETSPVPANESLARGQRYR